MAHSGSTGRAPSLRTVGEATRRHQEGCPAPGTSQSGGDRQVNRERAEQAASGAQEASELQRWTMDQATVVWVGERAGLSVEGQRAEPQRTSSQREEGVRPEKPPPRPLGTGTSTKAGGPQTAELLSGPGLLPPVQVTSTCLSPASSAHQVLFILQGLAQESLSRGLCFHLSPCSTRQTLALGPPLSCLRSHGARDTVVFQHERGPSQSREGLVMRAQGCCPAATGSGASGKRWRGHVCVRGASSCPRAEGGLEPGVIRKELGSGPAWAREAGALTPADNRGQPEPGPCSVPCRACPP